MKKIVLLSFVFFAVLCAQSQNLSYGATFGASYYDFEINNSGGSITPGLVDKPNYHVGAYIDYQFSKRFGIKLNTLYNRSYESYTYRFISNYQDLNFIINSLQLIPHLKFDVETEYEKGFYFLAGPRFNFIISAKDQFDNDVKNFYKSTTIGAQFGFGINIARKFAIELLGDYGFSNISDSGSAEIRSAGGHLNFIVNLESFINK